MVDGRLSVRSSSPQRAYSSWEVIVLKLAFIMQTNSMGVAVHHDITLLHMNEQIL